MPEGPSDQLPLFTIRRHTCRALVTNLGLERLNVWRFYNDRAALDLIVRELKGDSPLGRVPTRHFFLNLDPVVQAHLSAARVAEADFG